MMRATIHIIHMERRTSDIRNNLAKSKHVPHSESTIMCFANKLISHEQK